MGGGGGGGGGEGVISSIFLVHKKDGCHRPVINLKNLNSFLNFQHFKMEGIDMLDVFFFGETGSKRRIVHYPGLERTSKVWNLFASHLHWPVHPKIFTKIMKPVVTDLRNLEIHLKIRSIRRECKCLIANPIVTLRQLPQRLGHLSFSIQLGFPAPL